MPITGFYVYFAWRQILLNVIKLIRKTNKNHITICALAHACSLSFSPCSSLLLSSYPSIFLSFSLTLNIYLFAIDSQSSICKSQIFEIKQENFQREKHEKRIIDVIDHNSIMVFENCHWMVSTTSTKWGTMPMLLLLFFCCISLPKDYTAYEEMIIAYRHRVLTFCIGISIEQANWPFL